MSLARTPAPPYWAVIFTSLRTEAREGYAQTAEQMVALAAQQPGFLGVEHAGPEEGAVDSGPSITVSYWSSPEAIAAWKEHADHRSAQAAGQARWYRGYALRVARVERETRFER